MHAHRLVYVEQPIDLIEDGNKDSAAADPENARQQTRHDAGCGHCGHERRHFADKRTWPHRNVVHNVNGTGYGNSTHPPLMLMGAPDQLVLGWTEKLSPTLMPVAPGPTTPQVLPERTTKSPQLAPVGGQYVLAWAGTDTQLNVRYGGPGAFGPAVQLDARSYEAPTLATLGDEVILAWKGTDRRLNLAFLQGYELAGHVALEEGVSEAVTLCAFGSGLVMAWTAGGVRGWLALRSVAPDLRVGPVTTLEATSPHPPALCAHRGQLLLAWTGGDRRLNFARLLAS
jgi:hypothetical protein